MVPSVILEMRSNLVLVPGVFTRVLSTGEVATSLMRVVCGSWKASQATNSCTVSVTPDPVLPLRIR